MRASRWLIVFAMVLMLVTPAALLVSAQDPTAEPAATVDPAATTDPTATLDPAATLDAAATVDPMMTIEPMTTVEPMVTAEAGTGNTTDTNNQGALATAEPMMTAEPDTMGEEMVEEPAAVADLTDVSGTVIGQVAFFAGETAEKTEVVIVIDQESGLEPGFHGFHIHTVGQCDPAGDPPFSSAGGHYPGMEGVNHDDHAGDMPSVYINQDGSAEMYFVTDRFTVEELFDEDGSAVMVHGGADNFANIPERYGTPDQETLNTGDSGPRVACGVVTENAMAGQG